MRLGCAIVFLLAIAFVLYEFIGPKQTVRIEGLNRCREVVFPESIEFAFDARSLGHRIFYIVFAPAKQYRVDLNQPLPRPESFKISHEEYERLESNTTSFGAQEQYPTVCPIDNGVKGISLQGNFYQREGWRWAGNCLVRSKSGKYVVITSYDGRPSWEALRMINPIGGSFFSLEHPAGVGYYLDLYDGSRRLFRITGNTGGEPINYFAYGWVWMGDKVFIKSFLERRSLLFCEVE